MAQLERDWVRAHAALTRLARERAAADAEEGRWLLLAWRSGAHVHLGYGSFSEYAARLFGHSPRATREKLRVAQALERLPESARALEQGTLNWCAARELTRVATADTERAWLEAAHGKTTRELERLVAGRQPGDAPPLASEMSDPEPRAHVLRFEVAPETFATFREAMHGAPRVARWRMTPCCSRWPAALSALPRVADVRVIGSDTSSARRADRELRLPAGSASRWAPKS